MNTGKITLLTLFCLLGLNAACSNTVSVQSATEEKVIVSAPADEFVEAFNAAQKECQNHTRNARYYPDEESKLEIVGFDCLTLEGETIADAETDEETVEDTMEVDGETVPEAETETPTEEEIPPE